ncbi:hypothetical protein CFOL_v3_32050 [Cephalotus follicularis]|uniref:Uncharacterized protein n=1 Tax=Cephalotus follicularis TaxID=3775 RepID=A0A1Q3D8N5_CEPFO|nr:hypothetical protein CFOL_v3_32050 [Cephalotus follicularis]
MKQSGCSSTISYFTIDDIEVSAILLELYHLIFQSESPPQFSFTWGATRKRDKRKRSTNDERTTSRSRVKVSPAPEPSATYVMGSTCDNDGPTKKVGVSSPATPLSFSPSESEDKSKHSKRKVSLKRKKEEWVKIIEDLTRQREVLKGKVDIVKRDHDKLKANNLLLKAKKQELIDGIKRENPRVEKGIIQVHTGKSLNNLEIQGHYQNHQQNIHGMDHLQPWIIDQTAHRIDGHQVINLKPYITGLGVVNDNVDPLGIPDLNVSPDEYFGLDLSQPCDLEMTNTMSLSRAAMAAQARQRRIQICRFKNSNASSRLRFPFIR